MPSPSLPPASPSPPTPSARRTARALAVAVALGLGAACASDPLPAVGAGDDGGADAGAEAASLCGNGQPDPGETCDDGEANGTPGKCKRDCAGLPSKVTVEGDVLELTSEVVGPRIVGAKVWILEQPEKQAVTDAAAHFRLEGVDEGTEVTLVMEHPDYYPLQSPTYRPSARGLHAFALQAISKARFAVLRQAFPPLEEETHCILAGTVARLGGTLYARLRQGEVGATVVTTPAPPPASGPIYFNEDVLPDAKQASISKDGGWLYFKVPPGTYTVTAQKTGVVFPTVTLKCRPGFVVNAAPSLGIQAHTRAPDWGQTGEPGPNAAAVAATDALCDRTQGCVEALGAGRYPASLVTSCKAVFRRALSFLDGACPEAERVRGAFRTFATCRAASCELALGDDTACPAEEQAMLDALAAYGPCYASKGP